MHENVPLAAPGLIPPVAAPPAANPVTVGTGLSEPLWETYYAVVFAATAILVEAGPLSAGQRIAASLALAVMVPWYWFVGRPIMLLDEAGWLKTVGSWRGPAYLTGMIAAFAVVQHMNPGNAWWLAFAFSPQCFQVTTPMRRAMAFIVVLNVVAGSQLAFADPSADGIATAIGTALFAIAFSQVFSVWTSRVLQQNRERAELIAELKSTQAELAAAHHEAGVLAERQRLAAEIHDTLAQGFLSIITLIQAAQAAASPQPQRTPPPPSGSIAQSAASIGDNCATDPVREHLGLALGTARENLAEARALVAALAPASLAGGGLAEAVARAVRATGKAATVETTCEIEGIRRTLPTTVEVVLLRVCQEALANVRKHAAASSVDVRLRYGDQGVELTVTDNGRGFVLPPLAAAASGFGLSGMRERIRHVGGTLTVTSAPGAGTTIHAEIPE